ncbi:plasmolipin [Cynoglossus semilaevis]|uniref:Plasmolipin n=1 Tax=Cynoglossus semilaevis TaxID=244447 RepID=A0A3P8X295_CYNSE|nr:plasmolipin [Cynoglossus semilaevis]
MADFPSKVTTETSVPNSHSSQQGGNGLRGLATGINASVDVFFLRSIPGILMIVEIVLGLLHWALICGSNAIRGPYGWVLFVAITLWILTTVLFFMILFGLQRNLSMVPWPLTVMVYNATAAILYLTAFATNAAYVHQFWWLPGIYDHLAAAAFFGAVVTVAYGASAFFSYVDWKDDGGNAATNTVPT